MNNEFKMAHVRFDHCTRTCNVFNLGKYSAHKLMYLLKWIIVRNKMKLVNIIFKTTMYANYRRSFAIF